MNRSGATKPAVELGIRTRCRTARYRLPDPSPDEFAILSNQLGAICCLTSRSMAAAMLITVLPLKFRLTQEIRASIMRANSNFRTFRGGNGRTGSAEDGRGGVAADDRRRCRGVCEQQYVADRAIGR